MLCLALDPLLLLTLTILIPELLITTGKNPLTRPRALPQAHAIFTFTLWSPLGDHLSIALKSYSNLCLPWLLWASALLTMLLLGSSAHLSLLLVIIFLFLFPIALKVPLSLDPLIFICFLSSYAKPSSSPSLHSFLGTYIQFQCCNYLLHGTMEVHIPWIEFWPLRLAVRPQAS